MAPEERTTCGGANVNLLISADPAGLEPLAGMAHLNGVPVRVAGA